MGLLIPAPQGIALFYAVTITTAFSLLENIAKETSPPLHQDKGVFKLCNDNEYLMSNRCCQKCPAGTRVSIPCSVNGGLGDCRNCTTGKDFTAFPNGLPTCLPCRACRGDEVLVEECTPTRNTLCECKQGTYLCQVNMNCSSTGTCLTCSSCPEGQGIKHPCNATANTVCENLDEMSAPNLHQTVLIIGLAVAATSVVFLILITIIGYRRCRKRREGQEQTAAVDNIPENVSDGKFSDSEQQNICSHTTQTDVEESPDSERHSLLSNISLVDTKEDSHNGNAVPISTEEHKNHMGHTLGLRNSINGHPSLDR